MFSKLNKKWHPYYKREAAWMPTGRNADHLLGPNADRAEWRRAECRPQLLVLGRNADSKREQESNQTELRWKSETKYDSRL